MQCNCSISIQACLEAVIGIWWSRGQVLFWAEPINVFSYLGRVFIYFQDHSRFRSLTGDKWSKLDSYDCEPRLGFRCLGDSISHVAYTLNIGLRSALVTQYSSRRTFLNLSLGVPWGPMRIKSAANFKTKEIPRDLCSPRHNLCIRGHKS